MHAVSADAGAKFFDRERDVDWLLVFLESFRRLGWLPPTDDTQRRLLAANDILFHDRMHGRFFEFRSRGARDDRLPPLTIFIHVDADESVVRIIGIQPTTDYASNREEILQMISTRAVEVDIMLKRKNHG